MESLISVLMNLWTEFALVLESLFLVGTKSVEHYRIYLSPNG